MNPSGGGQRVGPVRQKEVRQAQFHHLRLGHRPPPRSPGACSCRGPLYPYPGGRGNHSQQIPVRRPRLKCARKRETASRKSGGWEGGRPFGLALVGKFGVVRGAMHGTHLPGQAVGARQVHQPNRRQPHRPQPLPRQLPHRMPLRERGRRLAQSDLRPHWGKMHTLDAAALAGLYPRWDDFRRVRAALDPRGIFLNDYLRRLLDNAGPLPSREQSARPPGGQPGPRNPAASR